MFKNNQHKNELINQHIVYRTLGVIFSGRFIWAYFAILIYTQTGSLTDIFIERLVHFLALLVAFWGSSFMLDRWGYLNIYRMHLILSAISMLVALVTLESIGSSYILITAIYGMSHGIYWPVEHSFNTRDIHGSQRSKVISITTSINMISSIILPILAGLIINIANGYSLLFTIGILVSLTAAIIPFGYNHTQITNIRSSEFRKIYSHKNFNLFVLSHLLLGGARSLLGALFLIIPFLFLKSEAGVGALVSLAGLFSAILSFVERNKDEKSKILIGYWGHHIWIAAHVALSIFWSPIALLIQTLSSSIFTASGNVSHIDVDYKIRERILGKDLVESTLELNMVIEFTYTVARTVIFSLVILLLSSLESIPELAIRIIIPIATIASLLSYHIIVLQLKSK